MMTLDRINGIKATLKEQFIAVQEVNSPEKCRKSNKA